MTRPNDALTWGALGCPEVILPPKLYQKCSIVYSNVCLKPQLHPEISTSLSTEFLGMVTWPGLCRPKDAPAFLYNNFQGWLRLELDSMFLETFPHLNNFLILSPMTSVGFFDISSFSAENIFAWKFPTNSRQQFSTEAWLYLLPAVMAFQNHLPTEPTMAARVLIISQDTFKVTQHPSHYFLP